MKKILNIIIIILFFTTNSYSGEYSSLLKKSKTKNTEKLLVVLDQTILGLKFEKDIVQICLDAIEEINKEQKNKTINEIQRCNLLVDRYLDYLDLTKIYENKNFIKELDKIYYKIKDGKITSISLSDFENKINQLSEVAIEINDLYTKIRLLDPRN
jgi:hypothetical protein